MFTVNRNRVKKCQNSNKLWIHCYNQNDIMTLKSILQNGSDINMHTTTVFNHFYYYYLFITMYVDVMDFLV